MMAFPQWKWGIVDIHVMQTEEFVLITSPASFATYLGAEMLCGLSDQVVKGEGLGA